MQDYWRTRQTKTLDLWVYQQKSAGQLWEMSVKAALQRLDSNPESHRQSFYSNL